MKYLLAAAIAAPFAFFLSFNVWLWLEAGVVLLVSIAFVYRQRRSYPALIWVLGFNWVGIVAAILAADLEGTNLADSILGGPLHVEAVHLSMVSLVVFAAGIASGLGAASKHSMLIKEHVAASVEHVIDLRRIMIAYFGALILAEVAVRMIAFFPQLQQQLYMLQMLKFICIFLMAWTVFSTGRGFRWLTALLAIEVVTGMTGFFGTFKEAFFIILIALLAMGRGPSKATWVFGIGALVSVLMLSLIWTSVKPSYREWVSGGTNEQVIARSFDERASWMLDNISHSEIDYSRSFEVMIWRLDTATIYAQYLIRADGSYVMDMPSRYLAALTNILMPRFLFPDKPVLNDSEVARVMTGRVIDDATTSISVGYIAEAHYDFGIPWMFVPIFLIGMVMALAGRYFMTREAPYVIRQAFATTVLFNSLSFGSNFDKALGGFIMQFIVLALVLRFAYPLIGGWLAGGRRATQTVPIGTAA